MSGPVAVFGATGNQGRATIDALLARDVEVVRADAADADALRAGFRGAAAAFVMATFTGPMGTEGEVRTATAVSDAAAAAGVPYVVYSSVGGAERHTGIPHFDSKRRIEEHIEGLDVRASFLRPVFFMDNLATSGPAREGDEIVLRFPLPAGRKLQLIDVRDIGAAAAALLVAPDTAPPAIEIGTDELDGDAMAAAVGRRYGAPARYEALPTSVLGDDEDIKAMFTWFDRDDAYRADFAGTRALVPDARDFAAWLRETDLGL